MDSPLVERLGWALVHFVWEGAAVALLLGGALWISRRQSARARYALACLALIVLAVAPAVTFGVLASLAKPEILTASAGKMYTDGGAFRYAANPTDDLIPILVRVWIAGVIVLSLRLGGTLLHVERWRRRHTQAAPEEWQARVDGLARGLGIRRSIGLLVSERIGVPSAWGVFRAFVVLPTSLMSQLPPAQVETILLHELAHIRRHDYFVNLLQAVVETVLFYHPAVWWISSVVRREREHCCDDVVVAYLNDPMPYARALLHLEERRLTLPRPTLSAKESNLMNRIARILTLQPKPTRVSPLASSLAALGIVGAVLGGAFQAQAQVKAPAPKKKPDHKKAAKTERIKYRVELAKPAPAANVQGVAKPAPAAKPATVKGVAAPAKISVTTFPAIVVQTGHVPASGRSFATARAIELIKGTAHVTDLARATGPATAQTTKVAEAKTYRIADVARISTEAKPAQNVGFGGGISGVATVSQGLGALGGGKTAERPALGGIGGGGFGGGVGLGGGGGFGGGGMVGYPGGAPGFAARATYNDDQDITVDFDKVNKLVSVDAKLSGLSPVLRMLARQTRSSVVIASGNYGLVSLVLNDIPLEDAISIICKSADATWRKEGSVYYVVPRDK